MKKLLTYLMALLLTNSLFAQDFIKHMDTLCAPGMHGRGYVNKGDLIAAEYLKNQLVFLGVDTFNQGVFQPYSLSVNTFPGAVHLSADQKILTPGADFIIHPHSGGGKGKRKVYTFTEKDMMKENFKKNVLKILKKPQSAIYFYTPHFTNKDSIQMIKDLSYEMAQHLPVITVTPKKLIWSVGRRALNNPIFEIIDSLAPKIIRSIEYEIQQTYIENYKSQNVIGYITGSDSLLKEEFVVFSAHYDHLGRMGKAAYFPGANDNASGTVMLLSLAKYYSKNPPKRSVAFLFFSGEEAGLLGSKFYTENPMFPLDRIKLVLNLDIFGSGEEGITVVNGSLYEEPFYLLNDLNNELNAIPVIKDRKESYNSDHYPFILKNVNAWFVYTMGKAKQYHDIFDTPETLTFEKFEALKELLITFEKRL